MAQRLQHRLLPQATQVCSQHRNDGSQPPGTPVQGDLTPPSGRCGYFMHVHRQATTLHIGKSFYKNKLWEQDSLILCI